MCAVGVRVCVGVCVGVRVCVCVGKLKRLRVGHVDAFNRQWEGSGGRGAFLFTVRLPLWRAYGNLCSILLRINHFCTGSCGSTVAALCTRSCAYLTHTYTHCACVCVCAGTD